MIEADTLAEAVAKLTHAGQVPLDVKQYLKIDLPDAGDTITTTKTTQAALYQFTRQLADLLEAGIPLARCMEILSKQRQYPLMQLIIASLNMSLQQGGSFSFALSRFPKIFLPIYVHTVKAAESSGQLPLVMDRLAQLLDADMRMRSRVTSSLLYPAIILAVGLLTLYVLLSFVLPRLTLMFDDLNAQLPLITRIVVALSQFFAHFWWLIAAATAAATYGLMRSIKSAPGKAWLDGLCLKIPLLKTFIEDTQLSRLARTLGMLLESGVPIVTALESVTQVMDNVILQEEVKKMALRVKSGMSLTQAIKLSTLFPEMAVDLIAVGQESGKLEKGLYKLADHCERRSQALAQTFVTILGPAVLVVVVGIVGFMVVAMLLPMFQMNMIIN